MFVRKSVVEVEKELSELNKKVEKLEKELHRLEMLERMQAQHEIILAKKIADINRVEAELKKFVHKEDFESIKKEMKKLDEHEAVLFENARFVREIANELSKMKESHRLNKQHLLEKGHVGKTEFEDRFSAVTDALRDMERIRSTHRKKANQEDLELTKKELHERMSQLEYQNKLLMMYLKKVDELLQQKL